MRDATLATARSTRKKAKLSFFLLLFYFFSFRFALFVSCFVLSFFFLYLLEFLPHGTSRQASSHGASVATGRRMPTQSKTFARDIFAHTHTHRARAVVCVYACVSARCSMSGDAGSSSSSSTGRLLKFCFSSAVALSGSLVLALPLFLCRATTRLHLRSI